MKRKLMLFIMLIFTASTTIAYSATYKIVVLPFDKLNKDKDPELETLVIGISDTLAGALSNVKDFIIIDSTRVKRYLLDNAEFNQAIGADSDKYMDKLLKLVQEKLDGDYLIYGSFQRISKQINLTAKFLKVNDGTILKAASVHGEYPDRIFDLQEDLAKKLIGAIRGNLDTAETKKLNEYIGSTEDYTAYQYYIRGRMEQMKYDTALYPKAIDLYQKAVDKDPNFALAWAGLCEVNALWGYQIKYAGGNSAPRLDLAITQGLKAVELGKNLFQTHRALSIAYLNNNDFTNSGKSIAPAYAMNSSDPEVLWVKASLTNYGYKEMGKPGTESNGYISKALSINPDLIIARWSLAHSLSEIGRIDESLAEFNKILSLNQSHSQSLLSIALLYYRKNDFQSTIAYAKRAVDADPEVPQHHYTLGLGYYGLKDWSHAEPALKDAIQRKHDYTDAIFTLAGVFYSTGKYMQARDKYAEVLKYNPNYPNAQQWMNYSQQKMMQGPIDQYK